MKYLNSQQLAFILDIKKNDARAKMVCAWEKSKGIERNQYTSEAKGAIRNSKGRIEDDYPAAMPIELLADHLLLPSLQAMVDDIVNNYLIRPATKKYILCDYPEKLILKAKEAEQKPSPQIPPALRSMLPQATQSFILEEWKRRYKEFRPKEENQAA